MENPPQRKTTWPNRIQPRGSLTAAPRMRNKMQNILPIENERLRSCGHYSWSDRPTRHEPLISRWTVEIKVPIGAVRTAQSIAAVGLRSKGPQRSKFKAVAEREKEGGAHLTASDVPARVFLNTGAWRGAHLTGRQGSGGFGKGF